MTRSARSMWRPIAAALASVAATAPAIAVDFSYSGFGTIGYARSSDSLRYQRFIDDDGTLKRDSVVGLQVDAKLTNELAATLQVKVAADTGTDRRYEGSASWAFLSYRPTNEWLFRFGKQRIPLYLYSETLDVGATYDFVRLPTEMYSIVPSNDGIIAAASRTFRLGDGELAVNVYAGKSSNDIREWVREGVPGLGDAGPHFQKLDFLAAGMVIDYRLDRANFHLAGVRANIKAADKSPFVDDYPFVQLAPGIGYFDVVGPTARRDSMVRNVTVTAGADLMLPWDVRILGEFARSLTPLSVIAPQGNRGYLSVLERVGRFTPYVSYAFLRSPSGQRELFRRLDDSRVPAFIPGAALINATQTLGADNVFAYHQSSWAFGSSYAFSATSKLKAEYLRTHVYDVSKLVDSPPGTTVRNRAINVYSLSYSVVY